jgi:hypothetical protein
MRRHIRDGVSSIVAILKVENSFQRSTLPLWARQSCDRVPHSGASAFVKDILITTQ